MRVSEAYTELEPTFAYEKLESNIILNDYFNIYIYIYPMDSNNVIGVS